MWVQESFYQSSTDELKRLNEVNGGQNVSSVSSVTSILIAGENIGPSKLKKAQKLKIEIIDEQAFLSLINDSSTPAAENQSIQGELF